MVKIIEHEDGHREFIIDWYEAMAAQLIEDHGVEMTVEQFEALVEHLRRTVDADANDDDDEEC